jgi:hypothetical protein
MGEMREAYQGKNRNEGGEMREAYQGKKRKEYRRTEGSISR